MTPMRSPVKEPASFYDYRYPYFPYPYPQMYPYGQPQQQQQPPLKNVVIKRKPLLDADQYSDYSEDFRAADKASA